MADVPGTIVDSNSDKQPIRVPGMKEPLYFPKSMSDEDIAKAIKTHPEYKDINPLYKENRLDRAMPDWLRPITNHLKDPGWTTVAAKGMPIINHAVVDSPNSKNIEENYPKTATGLKLAGGAASMVAPAGMATKISAGIAPGRTLEAVTQGGMNLGVGSADRAIGGKSTTKNDAIIDFLGGAAGPAIGKFISPNADPKRYTDAALTAMSEPQLAALFTPSIRDAARETAKGAVGRGLEQFTQNPILATLLGGVGSHLAGQNPMMGAALGAATTAAAHGNVWRQHNTLMHNEAAQAALTALLGRSPNEIVITQGR